MPKIPRAIHQSSLFVSGQFAAASAWAVRAAVARHVSTCAMVAEATLQASPSGAHLAGAGARGGQLGGCPAGEDARAGLQREGGRGVGLPSPGRSCGVVRGGPGGRLLANRPPWRSRKQSSPATQLTAAPLASPACSLPTCTLLEKPPTRLPMSPSALQGGKARGLGGPGGRPFVAPAANGLFRRLTCGCQRPQLGPWRRLRPRPWPPGR